MNKSSDTHSRLRRIGILGSGGVIFFMLGFVTSWSWLRNVNFSNQTGAITSPAPIRLGMSGLVNPLLEYTTGNNTPSELIFWNSALGTGIESDINKHLATDIGFFYEDLNSGHWAGFNQDEKFSPASLLKVPTMIAYLKLAETQPDILTQKYSYDGSSDSNAIEDIKPLKSIQGGHSYTVDELLKFMIAYSDNNATDLLYTNDLQNNFNQTYTDVGLLIPTSTKDFLSPRQYSRIFRILYNATYLNQNMSQKALDLLSYPDFPQGIMAGVPDQITVAQKFGEHQFDNGVVELHDCGIIYYPEHPYVLCIMTKGNDFEKLTQAIFDISHAVYQKVSR